MFTLSLACINLFRLEPYLSDPANHSIVGLHLDIIEQPYGPPALPATLLSDLQSLKESTPSTRVEVHLMVADPLQWWSENVADYEIDTVIVQQECLRIRDAEQLRSSRVGSAALALAVSPEDQVDVEIIRALGARSVTAMCVAPGGIGRDFDGRCLNNVAVAADLRARGELESVQVDGCVSASTIPSSVAYGADNFVLGSRALPARVPDPGTIAELASVIQRSRSRQTAAMGMLK